MICVCASTHANHARIVCITCGLITHIAHVCISRIRIVHSSHTMFFRRSFPAESLVPSLREVCCLSDGLLRYKIKSQQIPITVQCIRIPNGCENEYESSNSTVFSGVGEQELNRRITINIRKLREMIHTIGDSALSRLRTEDICRGGASLGASKSEVAPTTSGEVYVVHT